MSAKPVKHLPREGVAVKRSDDGQYEVWISVLSCVGKLKRIRLPGRFAYQTPDGEVYTVAQDAAEHLVELLKE